MGSAAAAAGRVKKIVATSVQKMPMAQAIPSPLSDGFRANPREPKPLTAVSPGVARDLQPLVSLVGGAARMASDETGARRKHPPQCAARATSGPLS